MAVPAAVPSTGLHTGLRADHARLVGRLEELAAVGDTGDGGCCRLALTDEDRRGRDLVVAWMEDLDLAVSVDAIGNVVGLWDVGEGAPVMTGSHIDTVRTGGRYDGNYGVLAGLEVIETLKQAGVEPARPLAVAFFTDEEGSRYAPDMLGSLVFVGGMALEEALDVQGIDGSRLGDELERIGYAGPLPCPSLTPHAFVELHIEQGPVLEAEGITIGAVTGVQGISWQELTITGQSNHAGTTPMDHRHDPGFVAAALTAEVRHLALELGGHQVGTVGRFGLHPDLVNVVPAAATLTVDLRNTDEAALQEAERRLAERADALAAAEGVTVSARSLARFEPVEFDGRVVDLVEATAQRLGHSVRRMPSGAGHDAQMLARVCPTGMVFVPSEKGISHNPAEHTDPEQLGAGADVLLHVLLDLAGGALDGSPPGRPRRAAMSRTVAIGAAQMGPVAAGPHPQGRGRAARRPAPPGVGVRLRARGVPRAGAHHLLPPLVRRGPHRGRRVLRAVHARARHPAAVRRGRPPRDRFLPGLRRAHPRRPPVQHPGPGGAGRPGRRPATARSTSLATSTTSPIGRSSTPSATTSSPGRTSPACGRPSAGGSG